MRNSQQKMLEGKNPLLQKWFLAFWVSERASRQRVPWERLVFRHRHIRVCRFSTSTNVEQDPVLPLWLSPHAFMQTGHCCTWTLKEPTREFLSTVLGCSSWKTSNPSGFYLSYFGFLLWTVQDHIPQRKTGGMRTLWLKVWNCSKLRKPPATQGRLSKCRRRQMHFRGDESCGFSSCIYAQCKSVEKSTLDVDTQNENATVCLCVFIFDAFLSDGSTEMFN